MSLLLLPLFLDAPAFSTTVKSVKIPVRDATIRSTEIYWEALANNDGADLWTQSGSTPLPRRAAGTDTLFSFDLPAVGLKAESRNIEAYCRPLTKGHDYLMIRLRNSSASLHSVMTETRFET